MSVDNGDVFTSIGLKLFGVFIVVSTPVDSSVFRMFQVVLLALPNTLLEYLRAMPFDLAIFLQVKPRVINLTHNERILIR